MVEAVDFYQRYFQAYHDRTVGVDPSAFLVPLAKHLAPGNHVLDIGCGSGRDSKWLKERGFSVTGFERSKGLAALARRHAGCTVVEGDFEVYDFSRLQVDALLLCGALVHIPHARFEGVFKNILKALKPGGKLLVSLKQGTGVTAADDGRMFYYWQAKDAETVFARQKLFVLEFQTGASRINRSDIWLSWVLLDSGKSK
jgi:SAM-dependent methyltransferase